MKTLIARLHRLTMPMKRLPELRKERIAVYVHGSKGHQLNVELFDRDEFARDTGTKPTSQDVAKFLHNKVSEPYFRGSLCANVFPWAMYDGTKQEDGPLYEVHTTDAVHGYGPILYQIAMSVVHEWTMGAGWLMPNITGVVSRDATRLWRRAVEDPSLRKMALPQSFQDRYRELFEEEPVLGYAFQIVQPLAYRKLVIP